MIEWTDQTWNPVTGCTKVSAGCRNCYAERIIRRQRRPFAKVEIQPTRLELPLRWRKPRRVFVNSMSDLFHESIPNEFIGAVFGVMARASRHVFQVLTKRPEPMLRWFDWINHEGTPSLCCASMLLDAERGYRGADGPIHCKWGPEPDAPWPLPNVWIGVSVENQEHAGVRIPALLEAPAVLRFVSLEPLLEAVDLDCWPMTGCPRGWLDEPGGLDWIIVGGESGPGARPMDLAWARSTMRQCAQAGVPFFMKQLGRRPIWTNPSATSEHDQPWGPYTVKGKGSDPREWPADLQRREYPSEVPR